MQALVVGGSIAGLSVAHVLRRRGVDTVVLERSDGDMRDRGAGLGLDGERLRAVLGRVDGPLPPHVTLQGRAVHTLAPGNGLAGLRWRTHLEPGFHRVSAWQHLYVALREGLADGVRTGVDVVGLAHCDGRWRVSTHDGTVIEADLVVGADGHRSVVRRHVFPRATPAYAGYMLWRGMVDVDAIEADVASLFLDQHLHLLPRPGHHMVVYEVPAARPGGPRRLNWGWYEAATPQRQRALVRLAGMPADTLVIPPGRLHPAGRQDAVERAAATWPAPWSGLVAQTAATGGLFLNAIHEFVLTQQSEEPVMLVGDAAHLLSPITGSGAGMALRDAIALDGWLEQTHAGPRLAQAAWAGLALALSEVCHAARQAQVRSRAWAASALAADVPPCHPAPQPDTEGEDT